MMSATFPNLGLFWPSAGPLGQDFTMCLLLPVGNDKAFIREMNERFLCS